MSISKREEFPRWDQIMPLILERYGDGKTHNVKDIISYLCSGVFSNYSLDVKLNNGRPLLHFRINEANHYLSAGAFIEKQGKTGIYIISNKGKKLLNDKVKITKEVLFNDEDYKNSNFYLSRNGVVKKRG